MKASRALVAIVIGSLIALGCSSENKLGESCDVTGKTDGECESGTICGQQSGGSLQCLKVCTQQADCAATEDCNGVDGSNTKGCRLKDVAKK